MDAERHGTNSSGHKTCLARRQDSWADHLEREINKKTKWFHGSFNERNTQTERNTYISEIQQEHLKNLYILLHVDYIVQAIAEVWVIPHICKMLDGLQYFSS